MQSNSTPSDMADNILKALDDIIMPPSGKRASITTAQVQEIRTKVQTLAQMLSSQPSPVDLLHAIQATKKDVNVKTAEILQALPKKGEAWEFDYQRPDSVGRLRAFHGNFGMLVRAYAYIAALGRDGLRNVSRLAILNANYVRKRLESR